MTIDEYSCIMVGCLALRSVANRSRKCDVHIYIYVCVCMMNCMRDGIHLSLSVRVSGGMERDKI